MATSKEKVNYKALFVKLQSKIEVQPKTFYSYVKQHPIMDMEGLKGL